MVYSKVQWVGRHAAIENAFHLLVYKVFCHEWPDGHSTIKGATAWWNIRPTDPKPHSDLISYCTSGGVDYTPDDPPTRTFIYYLKAPDKGGHLNIYTKPPLEIPNPAYNYPIFRWPDQEVDSIAPIPNRLISFPIEYTHGPHPGGHQRPREAQRGHRAVDVVRRFVPQPRLGDGPGHVETHDVRHEQQGDA